MKPHPFREAFEQRDIKAVAALLADDVVYHSPLVNEPGFEGRRAASALMAIALAVFEDDEYTHEFGDERSHVLVANAHVQGTPIQTTTLLEFNSEGKIREISLMTRPLVGVAQLAAAVTAHAKDRDPLLHELTKPLSDIAAIIDRASAQVADELNRSLK